MSDFFKLENVFFNILNYSVSYIEFAATIAGILAVWLAANSNIFSWPIGLVNISLSFIIFWQVQLYSDVFLQIYFFIIGVYGWYNWKFEIREKIPIKTLPSEQHLKYLAIILVLTILLGLLMSKVHLFAPSLFIKPAAYPYADTFIAVASIIANTWLAKRILENWFLWIIINIVCIFIYFIKDIPFIAFQFFIFLILAIFGHLNWKKEIKLNLTD